MESARLFRLAERLGAYPGAVAARQAELRAERGRTSPAPAAEAPDRGAAAAPSQGPRPRLWSRAEVPVGGQP